MANDSYWWLILVASRNQMKRHNDQCDPWPELACSARPLWHHWPASCWISLVMAWPALRLGASAWRLMRWEMEWLKQRKQAYIVSWIWMCWFDHDHGFLINITDVCWSWPRICFTMSLICQCNCSFDHFFVSHREPSNWITEWFSPTEWFGIGATDKRQAQFFHISNSEW